MPGEVMVQGVSSDAGKSFVVTALCRWLARRGVRCAPFKAQNMSNNARVGDGGEIGSAQWLQARAAGVVPDVRMNPVLLKPESDVRSQVVVNGNAHPELTDAPWPGRSKQLWPHVRSAYESLREQFDIIVIEGAGSPAETNLWNDDLVNMRVADLADAPVLLVADIDRGGAFAHLYGTWALLPRPWQRRIEAFLLNKFRGDVRLLDPAPADLEAMTGVPTIGVIPYVAHGLPDEEGPTPLAPRAARLRVALICGPYASNLDEFAPLQQSARVDLIRTNVTLTHDLVVLPGSKHVAADLAWLRQTGLADRVKDAAARGTPLLGVCGGLQILGGAIRDPAGVEGAGTGLGLLDVTTTLVATKRTVRDSVTFRSLGGPWGWLSGRTVTGYEIRHGRSAGNAAAAASRGGVAFVRENVLGVYVHGLFEDPGVVRSLTGTDPPPLDAEFDRLADLVDGHVDTGWLVSRLGL